MVTVKLYGMDYSPRAQRVWITAHEIGVNVTLVPTDLNKGEHRDPDYISTKHPFGTIPALEDEDGTIVYESRAICRYLVTKYGKDSPLLPGVGDLKAYVAFEQAASIEYSVFDPPASAVVYERVVVPIYGGTPNEELIKKHTDNLKAKMEGYELILSKQKYLGGNTLTLADLFHIPYGSLISQLEPDILSSKPHVKAWWNDISSRESWKATPRYM
ncbi:unnamed protein product [Rhizoctonia solani]|uniref:glutathione transferase n=1 Tax=Rhizoctonia solani TaxID=456999 RepID=A0A8H2WJS3_9AGAM|nr:unnamed protein product [Rhizoctonia solani]